MSLLYVYNFFQNSNHTPSTYLEVFVINIQPYGTEHPLISEMRQVYCEEMLLYANAGHPHIYQRKQGPLRRRWMIRIQRDRFQCPNEMIEEQIELSFDSTPLWRMSSTLRLRHPRYLSYFYRAARQAWRQGLFYCGRGPGVVELAAGWRYKNTYGSCVEAWRDTAYCEGSERLLHSLPVVTSTPPSSPEEEERDMVELGRCQYRAYLSQDPREIYIAAAAA
jgi:hypothetical protein